MVTKFLPLMAERFARQRLRAVAKLEGVHLDGKPTVQPLWPNEALTSPASSLNRGPTKRSAPPTS
jgi:hypothetical protein